MLSRIADSLFWLNRYMERMDGLLRLTYVHYILSLDRDVNRNISWKPVLEIFTDIPPEEMDGLENDVEAVLKKLLIDTTNTNALKTIIHKARENARGVQDHITKEVWEEVNHMYHLINDPSLTTRLNEHEGLQIIEQFRKHSVQYIGLVDSTMSRGLGWRFMNLGKYMERCLQTVVITGKQLELITATENEANDILQWRYLLLSLSGYEMHLKTYRSSNHNHNAMHQVIVDENFTRSVMYSLSHIDYYLKNVTGRNDDKATASLLRNFGLLYSKVKFFEPQKLDSPDLQPFLIEIKNDLLNLNKQLGQHFFSYS